MTMIETESGEQIETTLPPEAVADLQAPKPEEKPQEPAQAPETPAVEPKTEEPQTPKEEPAQPEAPSEPAKERQGKKATPFQTLLEKKHEAEERASKAEANQVQLEARIQELSQKPDNASTDQAMKALAEKWGLEEAFVAEVVSLARQGVNPQLPKEVQDLVAKQKEIEQQQAEEAAFTADFKRLESTLGDELLAKPEVREKIQELAYSTQKAPDGEPYYKKPLFELYHKFVKPEMEPGTVTVEENRGGSKAGAEVVDFQAIFERDNPKEIEDMDSQTFRGYSGWLDKKGGDVPITRARP